LSEITWNLIVVFLGTTIKRLEAAHKRGLSSVVILQTRWGGSSGANVRTFWCKKTSDFSKFMVCPLGQGERGLSQCGQWGIGGQFFPILCGCLLWTAPYLKL